MQRQKEMAICEAKEKPGAGPPSRSSEGTNPADTLISGVWPPGLRGNSVLLRKPLTLHGRPSKLIIHHPKFKCLQESEGKQAG